MPEGQQVYRSHEHFELFFNDISELSSREDSWGIPMCFCTGPQSREHKVHLCYNKKFQNDFEGPLCTVSDFGTFEAFVGEFADIMAKRFGLPLDRNMYYGVGKDNLMRHLSCKNSFALRIECSSIYFTADRVAKIKAIADLLAEAGAIMSQSISVVVRMAVPGGAALEAAGNVFAPQVSQTNILGKLGAVLGNRKLVEEKQEEFYKTLDHIFVMLDKYPQYYGKSVIVNGLVAKYRNVRRSPFFLEKIE